MPRIWIKGRLQQPLTFGVAVGYGVALACTSVYAAAGATTAAKSSAWTVPESIRKSAEAARKKEATEVAAKGAIPTLPLGAAERQACLAHERMQEYWRQLELIKNAVKRTESDFDHSAISRALFNMSSERKKAFHSLVLRTRDQRILNKAKELDDRITFPLAANETEKRIKLTEIAKGLNDLRDEIESIREAAAVYTADAVLSSSQYGQLDCVERAAALTKAMSEVNDSPLALPNNIDEQSDIEQMVGELNEADCVEVLVQKGRDLAVSLKTEDALSIERTRPKPFEDRPRPVMLTNTIAGATNLQDSRRPAPAPSDQNEKQLQPGSEPQAEPGGAQDEQKSEFTSDDLKPKGSRSKLVRRASTSSATATLDSKVPALEQPAKRAATIEKLKTQFQAVQDAPSTDPEALTAAEEAALAAKKPRSNDVLTVHAQNMLGEGAPLDTGPWFLEREANQNKTGDEDFRKLYSKYVRARKHYQNLVVQMSKAPKKTGVEKIKAIAKALNEDFLKKYRSKNPEIKDALGQGGNCVARSKTVSAFVTAILKDLGLKPDAGTAIGVQVFDDHLQPVLVQKIAGQKSLLVTGLVGNSSVKGVVAPIYKPESLVHRELRMHGDRSPSKYEDLLLIDVSPEMKLAGQHAAETAGIDVTQAKKLREASFGPTQENASGDFPETGLYYSTTPPPNEALSAWDDEAEPKEAASFYDRDQVQARSAARQEQRDEEGEQKKLTVDYSGASATLQSQLQSNSFKQYEQWLRDPSTLAAGIADGSVSRKTIDDVRAAEAKMYETLYGSKFVKNDDWKESGRGELSRKLALEHPELQKFYETAKKTREAFQRESALNVYRLVGPEKWPLVKAALDSNPDEFIVATALKKPGLAPFRVESLDAMVADPTQVSFLAEYQKSIRTKVDRKNSEVRGREKKTEKPRAGFGADSKGLSVKPELQAPIELEPHELAGYVANVDRHQAGTVKRGVLKRWTPTLTAAIRDEGLDALGKHGLEWLGNGGYRDLADARDPKERVISGPDKKALPKDVAVLVVDLLRGEGGGGASPTRLRAQVVKNYGSVEQYFQKIEREFQTGQASPQAKDEKSQGSTTNIEVFKKLATAQGIGQEVFSNADPKSFEFKRRGPKTFTMGSPVGEKGHQEDEISHSVTLTKAYEVQVTPVTQLQWALVMGSNPSQFKEEDSADGDRIEIKGMRLNANHPVESIPWEDNSSHEDVKTFIEKLNAQDPAYTYRLLTEAEWEAAARAGTSTAYFYGDNPGELQNHAWFQNNSGSRTHAVAQKPPNKDGLYDVSGNVRQWVQDWYGDYPHGSTTDPTGPAAGSYRVYRGGSWYDDAGNSRSARRNVWYPDDRGNNVGLRLARTPK